MKKLFLLIPAFLLSLAINAATTPVSAGVNTLQTAISEATSGDILELGDGIFYEAGNFEMTKNLTIKAAEGAHPVIANRYFFRVEGGADITFEGIKFDGSAWRNGNEDPIGASDHCIRSHNNSTGEEDLQFIDCEFTGYPSYVLYTQRDTRRWNSITINNCTFYNNNRCVIRIDEDGGNHTKQSCNALTIENSTFANFTESYDVIYYNAPDAEHTTTLNVSHCTFYGHPKRAIYWQKSENLSVDSCIFSQPTTNTYKSVECIAGTISNCLSYNSAGYSSAATRTDNIVLNPLFADPANNDFTLHNASPARRQNGSVYGDPRWAKAITPITIPATLQPIDAMLSDSAGVVLGTPDCINFKALGSHKFNDTEYAKWPIKVDKAGKYKFTANVNSTTGQYYTFSVLDSNEQPIANGTIEQTSDIGSGEKSFSTNVLDLTAGEYFVKIVNTYSWSDGQVVNVTASYEGGGLVEVPATLMPVDALRSQYAFVNEDGEFRFTDDSHDGYVTSQWGKWNIHMEKGGIYNFTLNANSDNSHHYYLYILNPDESQIEKYTLDGSSCTPLTATTPNLELAAGNYIVKIENFTDNSHGRVINIIASYEGGAVSNIPGQILGLDALLKKESTGTKTMIRLENGDIKSSNNGNPTTEYAEWNINAVQGELVVTLNLDPVTSSGHNYRIELYNGNELVDYAEELSSAEPSAAVHDKGDIQLAKTIVIPSDGAYTLKLINRTQWSSMILHGITFTPYVAPSAVVMTDTETDNSAWISELNNTVNVELERTILGGMYNTICLPFKVSEAKCKEIFGDDVELYTLGSAEISGDILNLNFNPASDIWNGTPIMIKTSHDIVNPIFEGVTIESAQGATTPKNAANFKGTFVKQQFQAGDQVLLLMANNAVVFPQSDKTLKGFRAYFQINANSANIPSRARIVLQNQTATDMEIVAEKEAEPAKLIENGQLVIIKNGVRYNAQGQIIQ